jgi:hypothetical protein
LAVAATVLLLGAAAWYPYPDGEVPEWKLAVIDSSGNPLTKVPAHQEWLDPLDEGITFADSIDTDANGKVVFPPRKLHNRLLSGSSRKHPSAHIFVCWKDEFGDVFWDQQHPDLPIKLVLRKAGCGYG